MLKAKTPQKHVSVIQIYSNVGPLNRVAVVHLASGFTFEQWMRYPVLLQISGRDPEQTRNGVE